MSAFRNVASTSPSSTIQFDTHDITLSLSAGFRIKPSAMTPSSVGARRFTQNVLPKFCFEVNVSTPRATTPFGVNAAATAEISHFRINTSFRLPPVDGIGLSVFAVTVS